jgi:hypothetical protein
MLYEIIHFLVFLVVVCKSRNGMHFKLLKSDNICSFYTNLNIEKDAVHSSDKKNICTSTLFSYYAFLSIYFQ